MTSRVAVAAAVLLLPATAMADRHKAGLGGGGGREGGSSLWGVMVQGDWVLYDGKETVDEYVDDHGQKKTAKHSQWTLSLAGQMTQTSGVHEVGTLSRSTCLVGPRFSWNELGHFWQVQPYVQVLGGRGYERLVGSDSGWAAGFGLGVDIPLGSTKDEKKHPTVVLRAQYGRHWIEDGVRDWYNQGTLSVIFRLNKKVEQSHEKVAPPPSTRP